MGASQGARYLSFCDPRAGISTFAGLPALNSTWAFQASKPSGFLQRHGNMKRLVCFYCNKKSNLRYDGHMTQWPCSTCEAVNYLDENGDITDPPVATESPAPYDVRYSVPNRTSPIHDTSAASVFCKVCLKNQHLYTTSLQQYHLEVDPSHPQYRESERLYYKYKKTLEKTYPQVCADCEPKVLERMRAAGQTAKADYLRRLLDKTRAQRSALNTSLSFSNLVLSLGRWLWFLGLVGQLSWDATSLLAIYEANQSSSSPISYVTIIANILRPLTNSSTSETWAFRSLCCSLCAIWWNPKFKELNNGFMNHISGFRDWYKLQALQLLMRSVFYYIAESEEYDLHTPGIAGAHVMVPIFILMLSFRSKNALKVDMTPLWNNAPPKFTYVSPGSKGSGQECTQGASEMGDIGDILDEIAATPTRAGVTSSTSVLDSGLSRTNLHQCQAYGSNALQSIGTPYTRGNKFAPQLNNSPYQRQAIQHDTEEMEWSPTVTQTQPTFNPVRQLNFQAQNQVQEAPIAPSPFYGRLPQAPITPAHRLRNPPNQPRLQVNSAEKKQNFFNNITRQSSTTEPVTGGWNTNPEKGELILQQQKFFPPTRPGEEDGLADLLTGFSLSSAAKTDGPATPIAQSSPLAKTRHLWQAAGLLVGLWFWHDSAQRGHKSPAIPWLTSLGCVFLASNTILENQVFVKSKERSIWNSLSTVLGGLQLLAALCGMLVTAGVVDVDNFTLKGTVLMGSLLVHEIAAVSFGG